MRFVSFYSLIFLLLFFSSCEFSETMVLNADGSGEMKIQMDVSTPIETLPSIDFKEKKESREDHIDTTFYFKDVLAEKKDSIAILPLKEQERLQKLEAYGVHIEMDEETEKVVFDVFVNFKLIEEADNLFDAFRQINERGVNFNSEIEQPQIQELIKVKYSFENKIFKREAYITDKELHKAEIDSLKSIDMMIGDYLYKLNYTFASKIKSTSLDNATFSADRKTFYYQVTYLDYLKKPDLLDIEIELEN